MKKADRRHGTYHALEDVQFLGPWQIASEVSGLDVGKDCERLNPQLIADIVLVWEQASSTRVCATVGVKDRVVNETPLEEEEHSYFRTQVGRVLFLSVLRLRPRSQIALL